MLTDPESMKIVEKEPSILESLKAVEDTLIGTFLFSSSLFFLPNDRNFSPLDFVKKKLSLCRDLAVPVAWKVISSSAV